MLQKLFKIYPAVFFLLPTIAVAQTTTIPSAIEKVKFVFELVIGLLFVLATVVFLWGVVRFIASAADPAGREKSKGIMLWGIIGLAVMAAAWGAANLLISYFGPLERPTFIQPPAFR